MSGLYTRYNLSEDGLNATDAIQKLYGPQIQEDINLFAFADSLESQISSASNISNNQLYGLVNEPFLDGEGNPVLRTKFITNGFTFSDENRVWFDRISGITFDQREIPVTTGAPIKISDTGAIVNLSVIGVGTQYEARDSIGTELSYPATVQVNLLGLESGSRNATAQVTVNSDGTLSRTVTIVSGGSGYVEDELLEPIPACSSEDDPAEDKCIRYTGNSLYRVYYDSDSVSYSALFRNEKYTYTVKSPTRDGFFLFDDITQEWVYLGAVYNSVQIIPAQSTPSLRINRYDDLSSENLIQLYKLDGRSQFFSYQDSYQPGENLSSSIRSISNAIESVKSDLVSFVQNVQVQKSEYQTNTFSGVNILSDYRLIFRDPDGVIDDPAITFFNLRDLTEGPNDLSINDSTVPGIWLFTGEKYQRIFSSDDKPFFSQIGRSYLSPIIAKFDGLGGTVLASENGDNKYSITAGYYKPGEPQSNSSVRGFSTILGTVIQNLSATGTDGGFVFHRTLAVQENIRGIVDSWPLFSYVENGTVKDAKILAI